MKITVDYIDILDDCFNDTTLFDFIFLTELDDEVIRALDALGDLEYYDKFPKPFFKLQKDHYYSIKGIRGEKSMRISLFPENKFEALRILTEYFKIDKDKIPALKQDTGNV